MGDDTALPPLAVSLGDPVGIGPEVLLKAFARSDVQSTMRIVVFGDPEVLRRANDALGLCIEVEEVASPSDVRSRPADVLCVVPISRLDEASTRWGRPSRDSDAVQVDYIRAAFAAVESRHASALVTGPISKSALHRAGAPWPGHTEMLAELCGVDRPVMMLAGPTLRVVPLTTHVALRAVPDALTADLVDHTIRVTAAALSDYFALERPRVAVAGLNPHAGEDGLFGDEEPSIIAPAIRRAEQAGLAVSGPWPADTVFLKARRGEFDAVIGMYHDQALIPVKLLDFDRAVNVTLGLPIVRTSVDHGTAYDIAGRGLASERSMVEALGLAATMAKNARQKGRTAPAGEGSRSLGD